MSTPSSTVTISGTKANLPSGTDSIGPLTIANPNSGGAVTSLTSVNGDNTITIPGTNYVGCVIVPPAASTVVKKLKGVGGDTGIPIHPANPTLLSLPTNAANFILNVAGIESIEINWF